MFFPKDKYPSLPLLSLIIWVFLCATFGFFIILGQAHFEVTETKTIFIITFPFYVIIAGILVFAEYTNFGPLRAQRRKKEIEVLKKSIKGDRIASGISKEALKKVFYFLVERPGNTFRATIKYAGLVIFLTLLTEWLASGETTNLFVILISGLVPLLLLSLFVIFFVQRFIFPTLKQCRALLREKGEKIKEPYFKFSSLKIKFIFFLLIPVLVVLTTLSFVSVLTSEIIILSLVGLAMAVMVSRQLSASIYDAFLGIKKFAIDLPNQERSFFATGSLDSEIIDLSESLNNAAFEVYIAGKKVRESERELNRKLKELEEWYRLTVDSELEMVDLKKEIEELRKKLEKDVE